MSDKVKFTGNKSTGKIYYKHTGHPGGIKETTPAKVLEGRFPERVIEKADVPHDPSWSFGPRSDARTPPLFMAPSTLMTGRTRLCSTLLP